MRNKSTDEKEHEPFSDTTIILPAFPYNRDSLHKVDEDEKKFVYGDDSLNRIVSAIKSPAPAWLPIDCCLQMNIYLQFDSSGEYMGYTHTLFGADSLSFFANQAELISRKIPKNFTYGLYVNSKGDTVIIGDFYTIYVDYCR